MCTWFKLTLQDAGSYYMMLMTYFYDFLSIILFIIIVFIFYIIIWMVFNNYINLYILHNQVLELIWTLIPMLVLCFVAIPSLNILYLTEEVLNPYLTIKILGHQWYWSYEYNDFFEKDFDSFMLNSGFEEGLFRLLDVDNRLVVPYGCMIRGLVSSVDVIHSWAIPSMGVKVDAIPGRLNQFLMVISRPGVYFGQCSEICGLNHSFMPIVVESVSLEGFFNWLV